MRWIKNIRLRNKNYIPSCLLTRDKSFCKFWLFSACSISKDYHPNLYISQHHVTTCHSSICYTKCRKTFYVLQQNYQPRSEMYSLGFSLIGAKPMLSFVFMTNLPHFISFTKISHINYSWLNTLNHKHYVVRYHHIETTFHI